MWQFSCCNVPCFSWFLGCVVYCSSDVVTAARCVLLTNEMVTHVWNVNGITLVYIFLARRDDRDRSPSTNRCGRLERWRDHVMSWNMNDTTIQGHESRKQRREGPCRSHECSYPSSNDAVLVWPCFEASEQHIHAWRLWLPWIYSDQEVPITMVTGKVEGADSMIEGLLPWWWSITLEIRLSRQGVSEQGRGCTGWLSRTIQAITVTDQ